MAGALILLAAIATSPSIVKVIGGSDYEIQFAHQRRAHEKELVDLKASHQTRLDHIDAGELHRAAQAHYDSLWQARLGHDARFALSKRELALLRMRDRSRDSGRGSKAVIEDIAREASPTESTIRVNRGERGFDLDVEFPMSSVSRGEEGTRTKHPTVESLRKEVLTLISQVANDVLTYCQHADLATLQIGCTHMVDMVYDDGRTMPERLTLYKIALRSEGIAVLSHNPFLDVYSITQHFSVEVDEFDTVYIKREHP